MRAAAGVIDATGATGSDRGGAAGPGAPALLDRGLFVHERLMLGPAGLYHTIATLRLRGTADVAALRAGLEWLQARHPVLRSGLRLAPGRRPRFVEAAAPRPIPVRIVPDGGDLDWLAATRAEIDVPFPLRDGPLARAIWIERPQGADLVVVMHHAAVDAVAMRAMLEVLTGRLGGQEPPRNAPPLVASVEALLGPGTAVGWPARAREAAIVGGITGLGWLLGRAVGASRLWRRARPAVASRIDWFTFDEALTRTLERRARRERVTVYAVLATVFLRVLLALRPDRTLNRLVCPVDVRHQFAMRHPELVFSTPISVRLRIDRTLDADVWGQARALAGMLSRKRQAIRLRRWLPALERLHGVVDGMVEGQRRARRSVDLSFAHIGSVEFERPAGDAPIAFEAMLGATGSMPWTDTMLITSLRSAGRLRFSVSTDDAKLPPAEREAFREAVLAMVEAITA